MLPSFISMELGTKVSIAMCLKIMYTCTWLVESVYKSSGPSGWGGGYFYSSLDGMLVLCRVITSIEFACTHLYNWVERGTVRV